MQLSFLGKFYTAAARHRLSNKAPAKKLEWHEALISSRDTAHEILRLSRSDLQMYCDALSELTEKKISVSALLDVEV
jgi:hypothetical protein